MWKRCEQGLLSPFAEAKNRTKWTISACIRNPVSGLLRDHRGAMAWAAEK
jgi:hypothetical protein